MLDTDEVKQPPALDPAAFDALRQSFEKQGAAAAADQLCAALREAGDYGGLFYALLLKARVGLGVSPFPTGAGDLPESVHEPYEKAIREAARTVGKLYLDQGNVAQAWPYFRMIGEPGPVAEALASLQPGPDDDVQSLIEIGLYHGANPNKGFDLVLDRYGICNAITTFSGMDFSQIPDAKQHCIARLVRSLEEQLRERLVGDVTSRGEQVSPDAPISQLIAGRDYLFEDHGYHIDTSHLSAVAQFSLELTDPEAMKAARELCAYGERLGEPFQQQADPPFEGTYRDYRILLEVLSGEKVEEGLRHFRSKIEDASREGNTFPAEVYVNLLLRLNRTVEALAVARQYLSGVKDRPLSCPSVYELCQRTGDYEALAATAHERGDPVNYLAGLIEAEKE